MDRFATGRIRSVENVHVDAKQIDEDLTLLSRYTDCVRTYSVEYGQDQIAGIAQRHGMKVLQGLWLSNRRGEKPAADRHRHCARQEIPRRHSRHCRRQ